MSSVPMVYVESDIPEGVTLAQWRAARVHSSAVSSRDLRRPPGRNPETPPSAR